MLQTAKDIFKQAMIIGFHSSILYHVVEFSLNDIACFIHPHRAHPDFIEGENKRGFKAENKRLSKQSNPGTKCDLLNLVVNTRNRN